MDLHRGQWIGLAVVASYVGVFVAPGVSMANGNDTPGWKYAHYNCGCVVGCAQTRALCRSCCDANEDPPGTLSPGQVTECKRYCNAMAEPCCDIPWW